MEAQERPVADTGGVKMLPARDLPKGTRLGRFEVREVIGRGGMGAVYRAWDAQLRRDVAIKALAPVDEGAGQNELLGARFQREALAASALKHANVVRVYEVGHADDGTPFIVMEHLEGRNLADLLKSRPQGLTIAEAVEIMLGVCAGVAACHRQGIVHRDLKPANVFLAKTDFQDTYEVKVLDFGVSKAMKEEELTHDGQIVGTPNYMSPEQARGKSDAAIDARADQYAIGVLLYACAARRLPYQELRHMELMQAIAKGEFKPPREFRPEIPPELEAIIVRAMNVEPDGRFPGVHELGRALLPFASERAQQKWTWMFSSVPHGSDPTPPASDADTTAVPPADEPPSVLAALASAASRASTVDERNKMDRTTKVVSYTNTTRVAPPAERPASASSRQPSRSVVTAAKLSPTPAADIEQEAPPAIASPAQPGAAAPELPPHQPAPASHATGRIRTVAMGIGIGVVAASIAFTVLRPRAEEPLGVRNLPPGAVVLGQPISPAVPPAASTAGPAAVAPAAPAGEGSASLPVESPAKTANDQQRRPGDHDLRPLGEEKAKAAHRGMEARRRKPSKVEIGTNGVPIPP